MRFPSRATFLLGPLVVAMALPALPLGTLAVAGTVIIQEGRVVQEDFYAVANRVIVEGTIDGDLFVSTTRLIVGETGVITGDVLGLAWDARIDGEIGGSVRLGGWRARTGGTIGDDAALLGRSLTVGGEVGRDVLAAGWSLRVDGSVGRDVLAEMLWGFTLGGRVERSVEVGAHRVKLEDDASVGRNFAYRSGFVDQNIRGWNATASISPSAEVGGQVIERTAQPADIQTRAWILFLQLMRFLAFLFTGIVLIGLFRRTTLAAADASLRRPMASVALGLAALVVTPVAVVASLFTVILIPFALLLGALWLFALVAGAVPALVAVGRLILRHRHGPFWAFAAAALIWRVLRITPVAGYLFWLVVTAWGLGAWLLGIWAQRRTADEDRTADEEPDAAEMTDDAQAP